MTAYDDFLARQAKCGQKGKDFLEDLLGAKQTQRVMSGESLGRFDMKKTTDVQIEDLESDEPEIFETMGEENVQ